MRRGLFGLLAAAGVSLLGSRMSIVALPWFALVTTGSPARTGLVAFAEMLPYVLACATGGPALDRLGVRRASIAADLASGLAVVSIPLLHAAGSLHFGALLGLVGVAGLLRGFGDTAKRVVFAHVVARSGVELTRATSIQDGISRAAAGLAHLRRALPAGHARPVRPSGLAGDGPQARACPGPDGGQSGSTYLMKPRFSATWS